jgi:hypothetical protein
MNCLFCDREAQTFPPTGAYTHINCNQCGEYKISIAALSSLTEKNKHLIAGKVFHSHYYDKEVLLITTQVISEIENHSQKIVLIDKLFFLSKYIYTKTIENEIGFVLESVPNSCCYVKNNSEQLELLKLLKELGIVEFMLHENGNFCRIFGDIKMTLAAIAKFESGIESSKIFREIFMEKDNYSTGIRIENNKGNIAIGSDNYQVNQTGITESELIKSLLQNGIEMETLDKIRAELKELVVEYNSERVNRERVKTLLTKLKNAGGNLLLSGLTLFSKPEFVQLVENIKQAL